MIVLVHASPLSTTASGFEPSIYDHELANIPKPAEIDNQYVPRTILDAYRELKARDGLADDVSPANELVHSVEEEVTEGAVPQETMDELIERIAQEAADQVLCDEILEKYIGMWKANP